MSLVLFACMTLSVPLAGNAQSQPIGGFPADALVERARLEKVLRETPDIALLRRYMRAMTAGPLGQSGVHTKNLFLRDKKGRRHWLLVTLCEKAVDLKALSSQIGTDNLSLASPERGGARCRGRGT